MKAAEAHKMTDEEITVELRRLSRRLFDLRTQAVTEKIEDVSQFSKIRRDIARLKTERRARQLREARA
ncbi:MAG: 50S ribosomal protein L29 [Planctomycetota bacterium]|nr:MAG: 50S ribosomal protein L29 [Planctomycetota bacterium]